MYVFSGRDLLTLFIVCFSIGCSGRLPIGVLDISLKVSLSVSDTAQNYARNSIHPI